MIASVNAPVTAGKNSPQRKGALRGIVCMKVIVLSLSDQGESGPRVTLPEVSYFTRTALPALPVEMTYAPGASGMNWLSEVMAAVETARPSTV